MNPNTAEIKMLSKGDLSDALVVRGNPKRESRGWIRPQRPKEDGFEEIKGYVSPEEIERGYANFDTWCRETNKNLNTRQTRRKAERDYKKALKRYKRVKGL